MYEAFIDLDELVVRCKDKQAKQFIKEAVACYKAGAYRSCIVATWNAVVFDFLHKLRELERLGDKQASQLLSEFEKLRSSEKKFKELWQFESDIPKKALQPFELISNVEKSDIERLFEDRSRCAHPSMVSLEETFEATAELARYHLRSAVTHLLERPPVQGRAAKDRIFQDIKSEYFPVDSEKAIKYFEKGPLVRARLALIKDVILGLTTSLLKENLPDDERARQFSAINAISSLYSSQVREILNGNLSKIIIDKVEDANWDKVIIYLSKVPNWDYIDEACQIKGAAFIDKLKIVHDGSSHRVNKKSLDILLMSNCIGFLSSAVDTKLQLPLRQLLYIKNYYIQNSQYDSITAKIEPKMIKAIPEASFNELVSIMVGSSGQLDNEIEPYLIARIKEASIEEILSGLYNIKHEKTLLYKEMDERFSYLLDKISLEELIELRSNHEKVKEYKYIFKNEVVDDSADETDTISETLDDTLKKLFSQELFENLLNIASKYNDELLNKLLEPVLKENIPKIIKRLKNSHSYDNASSNVWLLRKVVDSISHSQWQEILNVFFQNSQISGSRGCISTYEFFFKESISINDSLKSDWLAFKEKLERFSNNDRNINKLRNVIDSKLAS